MNEWIVLAGLVTGLAMCALLVSFYALYRSLRGWHRATAMLEAARAEWLESNQAVMARLDGLAAEREESPRRALAEPLPGTAKPGMNLSRRSQALRLRRKGESPEEIARSLALPRQEVELLLKVHEIVMNQI